MTQTASPTAATTRSGRWRTTRWVVLALVLVTAVAAVSTYLTAPQPGGRMEPASTSPQGAHALVSLLRDHGVDVVAAADVAEVEAAARPDSLVVIAQTSFLSGDDQLQRLAAVPGDRLVIEPVANTREVLAPEVRLGSDTSFGGEPDCELAEANRAGSVQFGMSDTFESTGDTAVTRCYDGAVVRYRDGDRTVTVVGSAQFMSNSGLPQQGNAALAMNLAGTSPHVVWYAPQQQQGESTGDATIFELIPDRVSWIVWQLCVVVALLALWKVRRVGPLVAEQLPVVVRASETVEGRGRLYQSRRARDRAAAALRTATLQRLLPRLGFAANAAPPAVVQTVATRCGHDAGTVEHALFGPPPHTDTDLVNLARELDYIERQVAQS